MATVDRYQGGGIQPVSTPTAPLTGTRIAQPTSAIGDALQQAGEVGTRLYVAYTQANDARHLLEAEGEMQREILDFAKWQQANQDESAWLPEFEKRTKKLEDAFGKRPISDRARLALNRSFGSWSTGETMQLQGQTVKQAGARARQAAQNTITRAIEQGDEPTAMAAFDTLGASGVMFPEEVEAGKLELAGTFKSKRQKDAVNLAAAALDERDIDGAREIIRSSELDASEKRMRLAQIDAGHAVNIQKDEFQALALTDPQKAISELDDPAKFNLLSPGDREAMRVQAKNILAGQSSDAWRDIKTRIELGQVKKGETFEAIKELDPLTRDVARLYNATYHDKASANSPAEYETVIAAIDNLQDDGSGLPRAQLEAAIDARFTGPYAEQLKKRLDDKFADPSKTEVLKEALGQLNRWAFDEKRFGEYQQPALGPDGNPVVTEKSVKTQAPDYGILGWRSLFGMGARGTTVETFKDQPSPVMVDDPAKRDAIAAKLGMIRMALENEVKAGKITTPEEAMQRAAELSGQPRVKSAASAIDSARPNPLLPSAQPAPKIDLDAIISKNANLGK